jgi:hypothetical protein
MGVKVNTEKTKIMLMVCHHSAQQNHNLKTAIRCFENVAKFKYLEMTVRNQTLIHAETKSRLNLGTSCYHSVQNLLSSCMQSKNIKFKIYGTIILPVVLYGCETGSLTLKEQHRFRVFENRVLRRIFRPKWDEIIGGRLEKIS